MGNEPVSTRSFGDLLRQHRLAAGISQEELAERAGLSAGGVSALERGTRRGVYHDTVGRLTEALDLPADQRLVFREAAAHGRGRRREDRPSLVLATPDLPTPLTTLIGRNNEVGAITVLLETYRLVTVTGAGGVGKTRVAVEVATIFSTSRHEEVRFVDLSPISDDAFVIGKIASDLGIDIAHARDQQLALVRQLASRRLLLVLDNCEQLLSSLTSTVYAVLQGCLEIRILCTSRERLGITGEAVYRLPSLPVPPLKRLPTDQCTSYAAVQLFIDRAATTDPGLTFSADRLELICDICRRLDGMPLAIELAVGRLPTIGLTVLQSRLHDHFILTNADRSAPGRHQTMLATIEWSFNLLTDVERVLLCRLAIFAGRFTLDAVEAVCSDFDLSQAIIPHTLSRLVNKSLVDAIIDDEPLRYRMLDSIREYAVAKLIQTREAAAIAERHGRWIGEFAERAKQRNHMLSRRAWLSEVEPELDNVRAALQWALSAECVDTTLAAQIVGNLRRIWISTGRHVECRVWSEKALIRIDRAQHPAIVALLLRALLQCVHDDSMFALAEETIRLFEQIDDQTGLASLYSHLTFRYAEAGKLFDAERSAALALAIFQGQSDSQSYFYAGLLYNRGALRAAQGRPLEARDDYLNAEAIYEALGDELSVNAVRSGLADVAFALGEAQRAATIVEGLRSHASQHGPALAAMHLPIAEADYRLSLRDLEAAKNLACEGLAAALGRTSSVVVLAIMQLATVAALSGKGKQAARLLGYINAWYLREGLQRAGPSQATYESLIASVQGQLSEDAIKSVSSAGALLTEHEAADEALRI